jgi:hypothetical protein
MAYKASSKLNRINNSSMKAITKPAFNIDDAWMSFMHNSDEDDYSSANPHNEISDDDDEDDGDYDNNNENEYGLYKSRSDDLATAGNHQSRVGASSVPRETANCDDNDNEDESYERFMKIKHTSSTSVFQDLTTDAAKLNKRSVIQHPHVPVKKTCISKKQQRRAYTFVDDKIIVNDVVTNNIPSSIIPSPLVKPDEPVENVPKSTPIYISTKTKISYLTRPIDIKSVFWKIPVIQYAIPSEGIIKKQIKFYTTNPAELQEVQTLLKNEKYYEDQVIEHIENPEGRIKFKDQRKISIGISRKDIISYHCKKKRAFFNCFVVIIRVMDDASNYKEMHVKVFNTGKLEIPGIQDDVILYKVLNLLVAILKPVIGEDVDYVRNKCETVLINSNFNCGYYINRDKLYDILKYEYRINSNYDACSYPGIQCKFFYVPGLDVQTGQQPVAETTDIETLGNPLYYEISFMIFRTGSILIVGKCNEQILNDIYVFIRTMLQKEYHRIKCNVWAGASDGAGAGNREEPETIGVQGSDDEMYVPVITQKKKETKIRKRTIIVNA